MVFPKPEGAQIFLPRSGGGGSVPTDEASTETEPEAQESKAPPAKSSQ